MNKWMNEYTSHFQWETCVLKEYCMYFLTQNIFPQKTSLNNFMQPQPVAMFWSRGEQEGLTRESDTSTEFKIMEILNDSLFVPRRGESVDS